jgi:hypothetical protein
MDGEHVSHTLLKRRALPLSFVAVAAGGVLFSDHVQAASSVKTVTEQGPTVDERWGEGTNSRAVDIGWAGALSRQAAVNRAITAKAMK